MRIRLLAVAALSLALTGCSGGEGSSGGQAKYASTSDLVAALKAHGVECPEFTQVSPSGHSAGHGSCARDSNPFLGLDVYKSTADRDAEVKATADALKTASISYCIVYADLWSVNATGSLAECQAVKNGLGGTVMQG
ncbi:MAG: hypothetical protein JWO67_2289 [Streptosporangiaceae bacterium]|nr:hypothetical protein [Streptosporangiaceae bacterium]